MIPSSDDEDDLKVVKTDHWTIDPLTKKQIMEPLKNKSCNHIYEKATIYKLIEQASERQKLVRCPYMGCSQKDFKKTDLVNLVRVKEEYEEDQKDFKKIDFVNLAKDKEEYEEEQKDFKNTDLMKV